MNLEIGVFGDFELRVNGAVVVVRAQKAKALLAWLACHPQQPQPRDRLATLLWPDHNTANAKSSLRQALAGLRRQLPDGLLVAEGEYLSFVEGGIDTDIARFRAGSQSQQLDVLAAALANYDGDLLDGLHVRAAPFEEWLVQEREVLRRQALQGLRQLLQLTQASNDTQRAIDTAGRLLTLDPLQEDVHRQLMELYAAQGQLGSAQRQFKQCRDLLDRELGVPPEPATIELYRRLGSASEEAGSEVGATTAPGPGVPSPDGANSARSAQAADRRAALPSLAVMPFRNRSNVADHDYLADGMTEELINLLSSSANWRVCSSSTSFHYRDQAKDARQIGRELKVAYVVEGTVRSMANRVRINASLINSDDGTQIWTERYERPLTELFDVQDEVVHAIFRTLKNRLGFAERERVRRTPALNLDAWGLLIKAMQVNVINGQTAQEQLDLVREALTVEANYPRAQAYLSSLLFTAVGRGTSAKPKEDVAEARPLMESALANAPADTLVLKLCAGGLAAVGQAKYALRLAEQAFSLTGSADSLLVAVLMWNNRLDEAREHCEEIVARIPDNLPAAPGELRPVALLGNLHMLQGNLNQALVYAMRDQQANPGNFFAHVNIANVYGLLGQGEDAKDAWELAKGIVTQLSVDAFDKGYRRVFADPELGAKFSTGLYAAGLD